MNMRNLHKMVSKQFDKLDFAKLWPGFRRYPFALYTSKSAVFENCEIPWDTRFRGNTAIEYDGGYIAIWNVEADFEFLSGAASTVEQLAASLAHEMFHAYQYECKETRFPMDLDMLLYPWDARNYALKFEENTLLSQVFHVSGKAAKLEMLASFSALREKREGLNEAMLKLEYLSETAEGMAEYVGLLALKALAPESYAERLNDYCARLSTLEPMLFNVRRISYFSGALLLIAAHDAGINFYHELKEAQAPVFEFVRKGLPKASPAMPSDAQTAMVEAAMNQARAVREAEIAAFEAEAAAKKECRGSICGYDPMNMIRCGDKLLCKTFVMIKTGDETVTLEGKSLLYMQSGSASIVEATSALQEK